MTQLIDKKVVLEAVQALPAELDAETVQRCIEIVSNQPTVDAVPVRHGKWETSRPDAPMFGFYYCSLCGRKRTSPQDRYCPNCGADMRGADNE